MRTDYDGQGTVPGSAEPWEVLRDWLHAAATAGNPEPGAMCLATVGPDGPHARFVLLRGLDEAGIRFYSHYRSRKGLELETDSRAAVCLWWPETQRQVRAVGLVERVSVEASDEYFYSRPLESRYSAAASEQSRPVASRGELEAAVARLRDEFPHGPPRPAEWGGYLLTPTEWEFWIGRPGRLHERHSFVRDGDDWRRELLSP